MTKERYKNLLENIEATFTPEEIKEGWHFCNDYDGLPVGPDSPEVEFCTCEDPKLKTLAKESEFRPDSFKKFCDENSHKLP